MNALLLLLLLILCAFGGKMFNLLEKLWNLLFPVEELGGETLVTGCDFFSVDLLKHPKNVKVFFAEECKHVPCNPAGDSLIWYVEEFGPCHHRLTVKWNVDGMRTILWKVKY